MDTNAISIRVCQINPEATVDTVVEMVMAVDALYQTVKDIRAMRDDVLKEWLELHPSVALEIGGTRYYVGPEKSIKVRDQKIALETMLEKLGGDLDAVAACLSANAWKAGEVKKRLEDIGAAETFDALFETTYSRDLKTGEPLKRVQTINKNFSKGRS